jgi:hypothetical protein
MKKFMDENFLLNNDTAVKLYHEFSKDMPIIDYHCHINPKEIFENKKFKNITEARLYGDHYKWRVMRAYGIEPEAGSKDNFTDAGSTYYTNYLAAAKKQGISAGVGDNRFAPDKEISRQEMFTLLYNSLKVIGQLPSEKNVQNLTKYSDANDIEPWAKNAILSLANAGIITGSNGKLLPTDSSNRAQFAQVLYNLSTK